MQAGQTLGNRYRLVRKLGAGGMAVVWLATDQVLDREVAIKVLAPQLAAYPHLLERIGLEARSAARLSHPHIVEVHDYGRSPIAGGQTVPYVVMERVDGRSLEDLLAEGPLPWPAAVRACAQVAAALTVAHEHGIVHRDITPGNVMITSTGVKLVDFGISALVGESELGADEQLLGTPAYVAPERLDEGTVDPATDVYALGLLLYRTLAGRMPWDTSSTTGILSAHRYLDPAPLPSIPGLPAEVAELCRRCLAKEPGNRPAAAEVADTLHWAAAGVRAAPSQTAAVGQEAVAANHRGTTVLGAGAVGMASVPGANPVPQYVTVVLDRLPSSRGRAAAALGAGAALLMAVGLVSGLFSTGGPTGPAEAAATAPTPSAMAEPERCRVRYDVRRDAAHRFTVAVTVHNSGVARLEPWRLQFAFPGEQRLARPLTTGWQQTGHDVLVTGATLAAGGTVQTGFEGAYRGGNPPPTRFTLNDRACASTLVEPAPAAVPKDDGQSDDDDSGDDKGNKGKKSRGKRDS